ncbi:hypothetical protein ABH946_006117, partial [Bacillus sp. RC145]
AKQKPKSFRLRFFCVYFYLPKVKIHKFNNPEDEKKNEIETV